LVRLLEKELQAALPADDEAAKAKLEKYYETLRERIFRNQVIDHKHRPDGRAFDQIREVWIETGVLPRAHGSAIFTRGETQALVTTTLGTSDDMQRLEGFEGEAKKRFMLHYNFPPFSVGEVGFMRGAGRREIGHGALAERAISAVLPSEDNWPYARLVVDGLHLRRFALTDGCGRALESSCGRGCDGTRERRRPVRHPDRHCGRGRSLRRYGLQSCRHQGRHHRAANGY